MNKKKAFLVANWDWGLYLLRFALGKALRHAGYEVTFVCPHGPHVARMEEAGFRWINWPMARRSMNPLKEVQALKSLADIYKREQPDIVHHSTIKANLYGALAARMNKKRADIKVINTFMGLGYVFSEHWKATLVRTMIMPLLRFAFDQKNVFTVFSNQGDMDRFVSLNIVAPEKADVMLSEYVDINKFSPPTSNGDVRSFRVLMAARLLWDKGVQEFVDASRALQINNKPVEFWLAGTPDKDNPEWIPEEKLKGWEDENLINWLGHCSDMPGLLQQVDVATLPTHYNEGCPRFLVESASAGLPLIATDIPACRRIVRDGVNGMIIPKRDPSSLAEAIGKLAADESLRRQMSKASRQIAIEEFDEKQILNQWLNLYGTLLQGTPIPVPQES